MKRKLNKKDEPVSVEKQEAKAEAPKTEKTPTSTFADLGLDSRLLQATAHQKWHTPTLVQSKAIPLAIEGHDVLAKSKTGSGKTAAYTLPLLQAILKRKQV